MATTRGQTGGTGSEGRKTGQTGAGSRRTGPAGGGDGRKSTGAAAGKTAGAASKSRGAGTAKSGTTAPRRTKKAAGGAANDAGLRKDLREFVQAHPGGWGHNEWIGLVNLLKDRGHDTSDTDAVGMALERERLTLVLERVPGLGAQRVKSIADNYPRIWNLMQAGAEEIAMAANLPKSVAKRVKDALP